MAGAKTRRKNNFYFTVILNDFDNWTSTSIIKLCASRASGRIRLLSCCAYLGQVDKYVYFLVVRISGKWTNSSTYKSAYISVILRS